CYTTQNVGMSTEEKIAIEPVRVQPTENKTANRIWRTTTENKTPNKIWPTKTLNKTANKT
ncbi:MAG: hypothetical protein WAK55_27730, partial [Xanthobacteraceae bacterium]